MALTPDQLKAANLPIMAAIVRQIPNDNYFAGREIWVGFAHAIAAEFCAKREQSEGEPERVWFDVIGREHDAGAGSIINIAKSRGIGLSANQQALRAA